MLVLKATQSDYDALNGYTNGESQLLFSVDGNGNLVVGLAVLDDPAFTAIHDQLLALEQIDYVPPIENF